jgi:hypothetical protein
MTAVTSREAIRDFTVASGRKSGSSSCSPSDGVVLVVVGWRRRLVDVREYCFQELRTGALTVEYRANTRARMVVSKVLASGATGDQRCVHCGEIVGV